MNALDLDFVARLALAMARAAGCGSAAPGLVSAWQLLSPLTLRAVRLLCDREWVSAADIAAALHESEAKLSALLTDLAERHIVESRTSKGYHVALPDNADPEEYRSKLREWLDRQER